MLRSTCPWAALVAATLSLSSIPALAFVVAPAGGPQCAFDNAREQLRAKNWKAAAADFAHAAEYGYRPADASYGVACARAMLGERDKALDALAKSFDAGFAEPERAYTDPLLESVRTQPEFRRLLRENVHESELAIVPEGEPGETLIVSGRVLGGNGAAVANAQVFLYQTGSDGLYSRPRSDWENPRLFGYLEAGERGRFEVQTVRPGSYPGSKNPQHIHYVVEAPGYERFEGEVQFADDPLLGEAERAAADKSGSHVVSVKRGEGGVQLCDVAIVLRRSQV